jgi:hypothetical protein
MRAVRIVTLGGSGLLRIIHGADAQSGLCLCLERQRSPNGQRSDWTDSRAHECGATFSMLDVHPEVSASDSDDEDDAGTGGGLPIPAQAARRLRRRCRARRFAEYWTVLAIRALAPGHSSYSAWPSG